MRDFLVIARLRALRPSDLQSRSFLRPAAPISAGMQPEASCW